MYYRVFQQYGSRDNIFYLRTKYHWSISQDGKQVSYLSCTSEPNCLPAPYVSHSHFYEHFDGTHANISGRPAGIRHRNEYRQ